MAKKLTEAALKERENLPPEQKEKLQEYLKLKAEAMRMPMEWSGNFMEELEKKVAKGDWKAKILLRELNKDPRIVSLFRQGFLGQASSSR